MVPGLLAEPPLRANLYRAVDEVNIVTGELHFKEGLRRFGIHALFVGAYSEFAEDFKTHSFGEMWDMIRHPEFPPHTGMFAGRAVDNLPYAHPPIEPDAGEESDEEFQLHSVSELDMF